MSRYARRRDPILPKKERVELSEANIILRLICVGIAIVIAGTAFGTLVNNLIKVQTGWQTIEPSNPETGIAGQFTLSYNIGASGQAATAELKSVSGIYSEAIDRAYRALSNVPFEHYNNLAALNAHPNEAMTVDELLYVALETVEASGSRLLYLAPMLEQYSSLYSCTRDEDAQKFDPEYSEAVAEYAEEIAAFAANPEDVKIVLLPEQQVRLEVSEKYLAYAAENEISSFVDFGILLNAFLTDAAADALLEQGHTAGILTSFDGYTRALGDAGAVVGLFDRVNGKAMQLGTARCSGAASIVACKSYPLLEMDSMNYYTYQDGSVRTPYMGMDGRLHSSERTLVTASDTLSAGALALRTLDAYAAGEELNGISAITVQSGKITAAGTLLQMEQ